MPRVVPFVCVLGPVVLAACGTDYEPASPDRVVDAGVTIAPDGRIIPPPGEDAAVPPPDAVVELTECEEATLHSDLAWIQAKVFTPSCALVGCHAGPGGMSLAAGSAHASLVNRTASTVSGWTRVVPGSTTSSYLVVALGRAPGPMPFSGFMPVGAPPLCVEKLEAIERWILAGAPP